jgi:hypothetical protein
MAMALRPPPFYVEGDSFPHDLFINAFSSIPGFVKVEWLLFGSVKKFYYEHISLNQKKSPFNISQRTYLSEPQRRNGLDPHFSNLGKDG